MRLFGYLSWFFIINLSLIKRLHDRKEERRLYFFLQMFEKLLITWYFSKSSDAWSRKIHLRHWLTPVRRFLDRSHLMIIQIALYFLITFALYFLLCTDAIAITHLPIHKYTWGYRARVHVIAVLRSRPRFCVIFITCTRIPYSGTTKGTRHVYLNMLSYF